MTQVPVHTFTLANGMKILCRRNPANPTVSLNLRVAAGGADDSNAKTGLAAFATSLATKGTSLRTAAQIAEVIDSLGMDIGFSAGQHTSSLSARLLAESLHPALALVTEILSSTRPPTDEMERMRARISTGIRMKLDDPAAVATDQLDELIYGPDHPYGRGLDGKLESVGKITLDDIHGWYRGNLQPGAVVGVIVGDVEPNEIERIARDTFGGWSGSGSFSIEAAPDVAPPAAPVRRDIPMPGKTQSDIALGFPGIRRSDPDFYALTVGNTVLGRLSLGGRIGRRVRDAEGMAYYAYTTFDAGVGAGPFMFRAGVNPANVDRAIELALEEMTLVKREGITAEEMEDAVLFLSGSMARQVETNAGMAAIMINQELFGLGDDYYLRYGEILRSLTLDQVNSALGRILLPEKYCLAVAGPRG